MNDIVINENTSAGGMIAGLLRMIRDDDHVEALPENARRTVARQDGVNKVLVDGVL